MEQYRLLLQGLDDDTREYPHGPICSDDSPQAAMVKALRNSFFKKFTPPGGNAAGDRAALKKFRAILPTVGLRLSEVCCDADDWLVQCFSRSMWDVLDDPPDVEPSLFCRIADGVDSGPGASRHADSRNFFTKYFQGPLSASSPQALALYRAVISRHPVWALAEYQRHHEFGERIDPSSKLFFAKKSQDESRTCATEPSVNMMLQKGIDSVLRAKLVTFFGLNLEFEQHHNRTLARLGSVGGHLTTTDLTSASDCIGVDLCDRFVPPALLGWLHSARTPSTVLPDGETIDLPMMSTMGNGYTFSLQTVIFACAVRACYLAKGELLPLGRGRDWGVNGDDIVVPKRYVWSLHRLLYLLGFTVNQGKSFTDGPFRESCGGDYFLGHNVRGVYIKSLDSDPDVYSALNRLGRWCMRSGILLPKTYSALLRLLKKKPLLVPRSSSDDAGLHVPSLTVGRVTGSFRALRVRQKCHEISFESPEYLGYNLGLYISVLSGNTRSSDLNSGITDANLGKREVPRIVLSLRDPRRKKDYRSFRGTTWWWDSPGQDPNRGYDSSWEAVVSLLLDSSCRGA